MNTVVTCGYLAVVAVSIGCLSALVIAGHDSLVTDALLALSGAVGGMGLWERLRERGD